MNKALLLDRDGIINEDGSYLYRPEDIRFVDGIFPFCRAAVSEGYLIIVLTNQSGIARGYYTEDDLLALNRWMCDCFRENGVLISKIYYCPYHPDKGIGRYKVDSFDRKPKPGMFLKARDEFHLDLSRSIAIGDRVSDMDAGRSAGVGTLLLLPGKYAYQAADDVTVIGALSEAEKFLKKDAASMPQVTT